MENWRTEDLLRDQIRADMLRELGWPIVEESDIGRGEREGAAMEDQRVSELGQRITQARNDLDLLLSLLVVNPVDRSALRYRAQKVKGQLEESLKLLRQEGFQVDIPNVGGE